MGLFKSRRASAKGPTQTGEGPLNPHDDFSAEMPENILDTDSMNALDMRSVLLAGQAYADGNSNSLPSDVKGVDEDYSQSRDEAAGRYGDDGNPAGGSVWGSLAQSNSGGEIPNTLTQDEVRLPTLKFPSFLISKVPSCLQSAKLNLSVFHNLERVHQQLSICYSAS